MSKEYQSLLWKKYNASREIDIRYQQLISLHPSPAPFIRGYVIIAMELSNIETNSSDLIELKQTLLEQIANKIAILIYNAQKYNTLPPLEILLQKTYLDRNQKYFLLSLIKPKKSKKPINSLNFFKFIGPVLGTATGIATGYTAGYAVFGLFGSIIGLSSGAVSGAVTGYLCQEAIKDCSKKPT